MKQGEGNGDARGGKWEREGGKWEGKGREVGIGYPPVHPLIYRDRQISLYPQAIS